MLRGMEYNVLREDPTTLSLTIWGIYIQKLEDFTKEVGNWADMNLVRLIILFLLYIDDIVCLVRRPYDISKKLKILKYVCTNSWMLMNIDKQQ